MPDRRYDIDWVRVIAIGLLLIYHIAVGFQPWGAMIGFITNSQPWESLWIPMAMLNVWRIPLLFFVSGMGVFFALQNRNWKELLKERARRIVIPFVFGMFCVVPLHMYLMQFHYGWKISYEPNPGHLWFLGNIFSYVLILSPVFFYLKKNEHGRVVSIIKKLFSTLVGLLLVIVVFVLEVLIVNPAPYELYAMTWHGFFLGLLAFLFGFCFVLCGPSFWNMLVKWRWLFFLVAASLFTYRLVQFQMRVPSYQMAIESNVWIFSVFAFARRYLNRQGKALNYLSKAAYPIYIIHMAFLYLGSLLIFPLDISAPLKFFLAVAFTTLSCFMFYEFVIRRIRILRLLFGSNDHSSPQ
ncbi:hypothetical protein BH10BAC4_BH10BAC4_17830 [soil metagenome]